MFKRIWTKVETPVSKEQIEVPEIKQRQIDVECVEIDGQLYLRIQCPKCDGYFAIAFEQVYEFMKAIKKKQHRNGMVV